MEISKMVRSGSRKMSRLHIEPDEVAAGAARKRNSSNVKDWRSVSLHPMAIRPGNDGDGMMLLQFPADRRTADVRRCAAALRDLHGEAANLFWRAEMAKFAAALADAGAEPQEISRQAGFFMHAVQIELQAGFSDKEASN
jgi:hypothetical protein